MQKKLMNDIALYVSLFLLGVISGKNIGRDVQENIPIANVFDTTLSGMHYTIYTEIRTGDLVVVNSTIDSLKVLMYKSQIK